MNPDSDLGAWLGMCFGLDEEELSDVERVGLGLEMGNLED